MIENNNSTMIDFNNTRFVLINNKDEHVISIDQARKFKQQGIQLTDTAEDALEEADEQAWYDHYVGRAEELTRQNAKADDTF
jgi:ribosomal protein S16